MRERVGGGGVREGVGGGGSDGGNGGEREGKEKEGKGCVMTGNISFFFPPSNLLDPFCRPRMEWLSSHDLILLTKATCSGV